MSTDTQALTATEEVQTPQTPAQVEAAAADVVLADLVDMTEEFHSLITQIQRLQEYGFFKYTSKTLRNEMLDSMLKRASSIDETAKVAFRALKKVKRQNVPDEIIDALLAGTITPDQV